MKIIQDIKLAFYRSVVMRIVIGNLFSGVYRFYLELEFAGLLIEVTQHSNLIQNRNE